MKPHITENGITLLNFRSCDHDFYPEPFVYKIRFFCNGTRYYLQINTPGNGLVPTERYDGKGFEISFREEVLIMLRCYHFESILTLDTLRIKKPVELTDSASCKRFEAIIRNFEATYGSSSTQANIKLSALLRIFLVYVARQYDNLPIAPDELLEDVVLNKFREIVKKNGDHIKSVSGIASRLSISPGYLNEIIRKQTGNSPSKLLQNHTLFLAKQAAITSDASMKEIASNLGFADGGHFSKFFRQKTGMTYSDFKQIFQSL